MRFRSLLLTSPMESHYLAEPSPIPATVPAPPVRSFNHSEKVKAGPKVRFYCGAPLIASNGHRLGTM